MASAVTDEELSQRTFNLVMEIKKKVKLGWTPRQNVAGIHPKGCSLQSIIHSRPLETLASFIVRMYRYTITLQRNSIYSQYRCFLSTHRHHLAPNSQPFATFLTEFRHLVECVGAKPGIIILGDFNVPYGNADDAHARALRDTLSDANMRQNVTDATHNRGNILDLVITSTSSSPITPVDDLNCYRSLRNYVSPRHNKATPTKT